MLRAFQKQLDALAADYDKSFENHIKERLDEDSPKGLVEELKEFVRLLPQIERRIFSLYVWLPQTSKVKDVGSHFLTYMYQPQDFIPEDEIHGLFGYLDDTYLAAYFYELMLDEIEGSKQFHLRKRDTDLRRRVSKLRKKAMLVIPGEAIKIKKMIRGLFEGDEWIYDQLFKDKIPA